MDNQLVEKIDFYIAKLQSLKRVLLKQADEDEKKEWIETIKCFIEDLEVYEECYPVD
ncbi:Hypothetical protein BRZCDTV_477 [Brazilian cedratvirus IHUMI]|uniref:PH domain-containing protein n=1 Tax=Brazilian cedratvirus IHUMI TaxID=2126980 RepID=A0A2R8FFR6_9VIRU|nr:Hypothetical protein BRZCDTV_477 [Brazilian cedratvirus IHUMI]